MKIKLHRPQRRLWIVSLILLLLGLVGTYLGGLLGQIGFYLIVASSILMLLGTWII